MRSPLPNARLAGRYTIEEPIGRGRSTVYRATDTRLHRPVAVKEVLLHSDHEPSMRPSFVFARTYSCVFSGRSAAGRHPASVPEAYTDDVQVPFKVLAPTVVLSWNS